MKITDLLELRTRAEQNPKTSINQIVIDAVTSTEDEVADVKNIFVSFTKVDKLGINPKSKYDTPLGIYAYPGEYVVKEVGADEPMSILPFAGDQPYVSLFNARGNIINIGDMSPETEKELYKKIMKIWQKETGKLLQEVVKEVGLYIVTARSEALRGGVPGGRLWFVTMKVADSLLSLHWGVKTPTAWNKLFRMMGIDGIVDTGMGIIHENEKTQAVFFSVSSITNVSRHLNKYSPVRTTARTNIGNRADLMARQYGPKITGAKSITELLAVIDENPAGLMPLIKDPRIRAAVIIAAPQLAQFIKRPLASDYDAVAESKSYLNMMALISKVNTETLVKDIAQVKPSTLDIIVQSINSPYGSHHGQPAIQLAIVKRDPRLASKIHNLSPKVADYLAKT